MRWKVHATRLQQHIIIIVLALVGLALFCWGARVAVTTHAIGPMPGGLIAFVGAGQMVLAGYGYYALDFRGKGGKRAFLVKTLTAGATGFLAMLLARLAVHK
jgi:hypothetical protein